MLSILIPAYNFNTAPLVEELQHQAQHITESIELIIFDDHSTFYVKENKAVAEKFELKHSYLEKNVGRSKIRNLLAKSAKYPYLLFLDGDVFPSSSSFLQNYISQLTEENKVIYGGRIHQLKDENRHLLRWKYGFYREDKTVENRTKEPYLSVITNNLCVERELFESIQFDESLHLYGCEDILFGYKLKLNQIPIKHIDNPVFHKDIDTNEVFLKKTKDALINQVALEERGLLPEDYRPIQQWYLRLKKLKVHWLGYQGYRIFGNMLCKYLKGASPRLFVFDLFRMLYFCYLKHKTMNNGR